MVDSLQSEPRVKFTARSAFDDSIGQCGLGFDTFVREYELSASEFAWLEQYRGVVIVTSLLVAPPPEPATELRKASVKPPKGA